MKDTEKIIRQVNGNMAIEGMPITEADKARIRICLNDNSRFSKEIKALVTKHYVPKGNKHDARL